MTEAVRKIIFLDVDGVLNHIGTKHRVRMDGSTAETADGLIGMDRACVAELQRLVDATGALLILSSTWRMDIMGHSGIARTQRCMRSVGWTGKRLDGRTGYAPNSEQRERRGSEIAAWLKDHPFAGETRIAILDDDSDMGELLPFLVHTDPYKDGLCARHVDLAIAMLDRGANAAEAQTMLESKIESVAREVSRALLAQDIAHAIVGTAALLLLGQTEKEPPDLDFLVAKYPEFDLVMSPFAQRLPAGWTMTERKSANKSGAALFDWTVHGVSIDFIVPDKTDPKASAREIGQEILAKHPTLFGISRIASYEDVMRLKLAAGRAKDKEYKP